MPVGRSWPWTIKAPSAPAASPCPLLVPAYQPWRVAAALILCCHRVQDLVSASDARGCVWTGGADCRGSYGPRRADVTPIADSCPHSTSTSCRPGRTDVDEAELRPSPPEVGMMMMNTAVGYPAPQSACAAPGHGRSAPCQNDADGISIERGACGARRRGCGDRVDRGIRVVFFSSAGKEHRGLVG